MESTQQVIFGFCGQFFSTVLISRPSIKAPNNSSLGIDCFAVGATLVLEATNLVINFPFLLTVLRYNTAAYACSETSLNP